MLAEGNGVNLHVVEEACASEPEIKKLYNMTGDKQLV